jgi:flagellar hook assembly protein FlgD
MVHVSHATIKVFDLIIPKGFSPDNGDTLNNKFVIRGINPDPAINQISLRIVNSDGSEVFFTSNIDGNIWTDWNGENSKGLPLPDGTYYYLLTVKSGRDSSAGFKKGGFLVLKRRN